MAQWSQLPRELLDLISKHLISDTDLLRFRSVCTSWRSSVQPPASRFPILPNAGISDTTWGFYLSKRTIFRVGLPDPDSLPWLIKVQRDNPNKTHLMNPLTGSEFIPRLPNFPRSLDLLDFRVSELGQEYALQYINYRPNANSIGDSVTLYMEKVAFCSSGVDGFVLLTIHVSGKLAMLKYGDKKWNIINDLPSPYDDVIFFKGEFYAVDSTGRAVIVAVDADSTALKVVANAVLGGDKKFLVESMGELLLIDKYLCVGPEDDLDYDDENYELDEDFDCFMSERTVKLEVFRLDWEDQKWVEVKNLGDRMLFLGDNCGFSALASDFPGCKGNCVFFTGQCREDDGVLKNRGVGVFDLESGCIGPIASHPSYSELFWPPPPWLLAPASLEVGIDQLNI